VKFKERRTVTTHNKTVSHIVIIVCFGSIWVNFFRYLSATSG
jgi:hypothetical protein